MPQPDRPDAVSQWPGTSAAEGKEYQMSEIAPLHEENAELRRLLAAHGIAPPAEPPDCPVPSELETLRALVVNAYPRLILGQSEQAFRTGFADAFRWLTTMRRAETVDISRYIGFWIDRCTAWLARQMIPGEITGSALLAAAAAHGDVPFILADPRNGILPALGLKPHETGRTYRGAWRDVLRTRVVPEPVPLPQLANPVTVIETNLIRGGDRLGGGKLVDFGG